MIEKFLCKKDDALLDALRKINGNGKGVVFVTEADRLCGILTDGDIRRLLLNGHNLSERIEGLVKKEFVYAKQSEEYSQIIKKFSPYIRIIPVVDEGFRVVDYAECKTNVHVPLVSPDLTGNELEYLVEAFLSTWISSSGDYLGKFEKMFADFCECQYGVAVSNGTVALHLALMALGVGKGDEVIVPDLTFAATVNSVLHAQGTPVIVDVEKDSWCIDPAEIEKAITAKTKAIIPVHLYGQPCDIQAIMDIAKAHNLFVIEDCAEAHGALFDGKKVGSFGDIGCFSFFGNKIITTGEGGMCVTDSEKLDEKMRVIRDHGMSKTKKYWHEVVGYNYRMTNLQAAIGVGQLERIDDIISARGKIEERYRRELGREKLIEFQRNDLPRRKKITWLVSVLIKNGIKEACMSKLKERKIDIRPFFYPLSQMDIYKKYTFSNRVSCQLSEQGITFPTTANLNEDVFRVIKEVIKESAEKMSVSS
ncbi:MAG: aminotransferase class I/II-fold pyridoxal phosphate-dependent enzyme [Sedimentisphaerales bacterium]|nr:aminotransferase class I/II-fold pyridoxal phosphate-dependent enzyme [Sedimentisphaerales bacterium]